MTTVQLPTRTMTLLSMTTLRSFPRRLQNCHSHWRQEMHQWLERQLMQNSLLKLQHQLMQEYMLGLEQLL